LDPEFYPEFQYRSQGFVRDLFLKKKTEKALQTKLDSVLEKYHRLERPYFINFVHCAGRYDVAQAQPGEYDKLTLFRAVLLGLGFGELEELPSLTEKLVRSTRFRFEYQSFVGQVAHHVSKDLSSTLRSWIEEQGSAFRRQLPLVLYYLWEQKAHTSEIGFAEDALLLVDDQELARICTGYLFMSQKGGKIG
jgi:hypothetical protein